MTTSAEHEGTDRRVRMFIYDHFLRTGHPPSVHDAQQSLAMTPQAVDESYERLAAGRVIVLEPGSRDILMAAPLSAVPTRFRVAMHDGGEYHANCIWDALGLPVMTGSDATIHATCGDCDEQLTLEVNSGVLSRREGVVHFGVPARRWWADIVFT